jgi:hypothetical protein
MTTLQLSEVKTCDIICQPVQKNSHGSIYAPISYKDSKFHPRIQLGDIALKCPFGASSFDPNSRLNLDLCVPKDRTDILDVLRNIDNHVVEHVWKNVASFFPKKAPTTKELLREMYCGVLKQPQNDYDPLCKTKINPSCLVWVVSDGTHTKGTVDNIEGGCSVLGVLQLDKIWTMPNRFGITAITCAAMVHPKEALKIEDVFSCSANTHFLKYDP